MGTGGGGGSGGISDVALLAVVLDGLDGVELDRLTASLRRIEKLFRSFLRRLGDLAMGLANRPSFLCSIVCLRNAYLGDEDNSGPARTTIDSVW